MDGQELIVVSHIFFQEKRCFVSNVIKIGLSIFLLLKSGHITTSGLQAEEPAKQMLVLRVIRRKIDHTNRKSEVFSVLN